MFGAATTGALSEIISNITESHIFQFLHAAEKRKMDFVWFSVMSFLAVSFSVWSLHCGRHISVCHSFIDCCVGYMSEVHLQPSRQEGNRNIQNIGDQKLKDYRQITKHRVLKNTHPGLAIDDLCAGDPELLTRLFKVLIILIKQCKCR